ncbi:MAG: nucleotidyltransferase domain-containing protein [Chitinophagaceae bacterium]|nr:nucleotidyltransferase domain-containing protein [Chitinophagaceae bacterium]
MHDTRYGIQSPGITETPFRLPEEGVLATLAYFDLFDYPLTKKEIYQFMPFSMQQEHLPGLLDELVCRQVIFLFNGYYLLKNDPALVLRRTEGNERARLLLEKARKIGRFLYQFPFVRAVGVSGSLSKNFADKDADIDFFIIAAKNRLWLARTFMHIYKKFTFLAGRQHYHCMNYYIDEEAYDLPEKNIFTAIEIKTLLPVCGDGTMRAFFMANKWADQWLPQCDYRLQPVADPNATWFKRAGEWLFKGKAGQRLENFFYRLTASRWKRKERQGMKNDKGIKMGLITDPHFARSNPGGFQEQILRLYKERLSVVLQKEDSRQLIVSSVK